MKVSLFVLLMLVASNAFASKARLEAFGESKYGSFIFDDYRNIYLNMAAINDYVNFATIELGASTIATTNATATASADSASNPKGEAGVTFGAGNMVYGLHYGYVSDALTSFRKGILGVSNLTSTVTSGVSAASNRTRDLSGQNAIDLMMGSKTANLKWGAALQVSQSKDESVATDKVKQTAAASRFGVIAGKARVGAIISLANKVTADRIGYDLDGDGDYTDTLGTGYYTQANAEFKGKLGFEFNGSFDLTDTMRVFGKYQFQKAEGTNSLLTEMKYTKMEVGISNIYNFSKTNFMFVKFDATNSKTEKTINSNAVMTAVANGLGLSTESKSLQFPISVGVEGLAREWLKLRASASMNLYSTEEDKGEGKVAGTGNTTLGSGATLVFGNLDIDGYVGANTTGTLELDDLLTRASMTYNF